MCLFMAHVCATWVCVCVLLDDKRRTSIGYMYINMYVHCTIRYAPCTYVQLGTFFVAVIVSPASRTDVSIFLHFKICVALILHTDKCISHSNNNKSTHSEHTLHEIATATAMTDIRFTPPQYLNPISTIFFLLYLLFCSNNFVIFDAILYHNRWL